MERILVTSNYQKFFDLYFEFNSARSNTILRHNKLLYKLRLYLNLICTIVLFSTKYGMYKPNCGLKNLIMSWGHDEYLYQVLKYNKSTIPKEGLAMIRYHSFYPWHAGGDYMHFCTQEDINMLNWVLEFK